MLALPPLTNAAPPPRPDAGQAMRDIESARPGLPPETAPQLTYPAPSSPMPPRDDEAFETDTLLRAFRFDGNTAFASDALRALLDDLTGRALRLHVLRQAVHRITEHYKEHGYLLARAWLPPQRIEQGVVHIRVSEGRYGELLLDNTSRIRSQILRRPLSRLARGDIVHGAELERALLLLDDLPGLSVHGTLRPGSAPGTTDLLIQAMPGPLASARLEADNHGSAYTGEYRLHSSFSLHSPLGLGDRLDLRMLISDRRQRYRRVSYQLPAGPFGAHLGGAMAASDYALGRDFSALRAQGTADVRSLFVTQPLVRGWHANLSAQLQYDNKHLRDAIDLYALNRHKRLNAWTLSLNASLDDPWIGGGRNYFHLAGTTGRLRLRDPSDQNLDARTARTAHRFNKVYVSAGRLQRLSTRTRFFAQINAQWASRNLDTSEKIALGGPSGVRAYSLGAISGDQGWQASAELHYLPMENLRLKAFVDRGHIVLNKVPWISESNAIALSAVGIGAHWNWNTPRLQISLAIAWPIGENLIHDTPRRDPRTWMQATYVM